MKPEILMARVWMDPRDTATEPNPPIAGPEYVEFTKKGDIVWTPCVRLSDYQNLVEKLEQAQEAIRLNRTTIFQDAPPGTATQDY